MPLFGIDDVLFLLASTTALLWTKRAEVIESGVYSAVKLATNDEKEALKRAREVSSKHSGTPSLLLPGFDLQREYEQEEIVSRQSCLLTSGIGGDVGPASPMNSFVRDGLHNQLAEQPVVYTKPNVPHRHYNPARRKPHVYAFCDYTEAQVKEKISLYSIAEVQSLFKKIEAEGLWEAAIHVSCGIEAAGKELHYLSQHNVECGIRTLFNTDHADIALIFYLRFGVDMLPSDDVVIALFHTCRGDDKMSLELCSVLRPFQYSWSPSVYACCLTATAHYSYRDALALYEEYIRIQSRSKGTGDVGPLNGVRAVSRALGFCASSRQTPGTSHAPLHYLYHIIIPLVVEREPGAAARYVDDMLQNDSAAAPDVFLRILHTAPGRKLALRYLVGYFSSLPECDYAQDKALEETKNMFGSLQRKNEQRESVEDMSAYIGELALVLYRMKQTALNMNTLLRLATAPAHTLDCCRNASQVGDALTEMRRGTSTDLYNSFCDVPIQSDMDAVILARTITEQHGSWGLATQFLAAMITRKCFCVVPPLAHHLARHGRWTAVSRSMALYLSRQRAQMTVNEVTLCIEAAVHSGQWSSALFWVDRAQEKNLRLEPTTYDLVMGISKHCSWEESLRVVSSMHVSGGSCTERGVLDVVEAVALQGKVDRAFHVLAATGAVQWVK